MRGFDEFIRESELIDPPVNNALVSWSNLQLGPICKRLDKVLFPSDWECTFPQSREEGFPRWLHITSQLVLSQTRLSGA